MIPVRDGFNPTPFTRIRAWGWHSPATNQKAAALMSPGTAMSTAVSSAGWTTNVRPSDTTTPPIADTMRSVWSRDSAGWCSTVFPRAESPASMMQDLTCALATGKSYSMPFSDPPLTVSGARVSRCRPRTVAPISCRGWTTRPMGRLLRESSPEITDVNDCPASIPDNSRMEVPLFPASRISLGSSRSQPVPSTVTIPGWSPGCISTPMALRHPMVETTSPPSDRPLTTARPRATAFRIRAR